jgi:hexosaminidase
MKRLFITACILCICFYSTAQNAHSIIPKPAFISYPHSSEPFVLDNKQTIFYSASFKDQAGYLKEAIQKQTGIELGNQRSCGY